jgi:hypothetical protein
MPLMLRLTELNSHGDHATSDAPNRSSRFVS